MRELLETAIEHHQAGRLNEAEEIYRKLLSREPAHADALHLLGVATLQRGRPQEAIGMIEQALAISPGQASFHANLVEAYRLSGNLPAALAHARKAIELSPAAVESRNNLGLVLEELKQPEEAIAAFEAAIAAGPAWPLAYLNLGDLLRKLRRDHEAAAVYREGLRLCGDVAPLHDSLGALLVAMGQPENAVHHASSAVRLAPEHAPARCNLGDALAAVGMRAEAMEHYARASQLAPALGVPHDRMGLMMLAQGQAAGALVHFEEALRREPENPDYGCHLASALSELDRADDAVALFRQVLARHPEHATGHNSLGYLLQDRGDMAGAVAAYLEAIRQRPDYADAYLNLGLAHAEMGDVEKAVAAFRSALEHDPEHPEALAALGLSLRERISAEETGACERVLAQPGVPPQRAAVLRYGLLQVMDARGQFERAASLAREANQVFGQMARIRGEAFDPDEHVRYVDGIIRAYDTAHFARVAGWGLATDLPVFVLGLPRSGTSLVEQIMASHPQVFGAGELNLMRDLYRALPALVGKQAPGVECVDRLDQEMVRFLARRYTDGLARLAPGTERIVDKMPDNYLMIGLIATLFPAARIIHVKRDVRDVGLSLWLTHFKHIHWATDLTHIGVRIREYLRLMEHWRRVLPGPLLEIDYETIVGDGERMARQLVSWCGLSWDPACREPHRTRRVVRTASMTQVREPIYGRSVGRWRHYEAALAPLCAVLD